MTSRINTNVFFDFTFRYGFGFLAYALTCVVALTALAKVRRTMWEVFYYVHVPASKLIYVMGVLHLQGKGLGWICVMDGWRDGHLQDGSMMHYTFYPRI